VAYDLGDTVPLGVDVVDEDGAPTTPGAVTLTITLPDDTTATPTPSVPSVGRYEVDYVPAQVGRYVAVWTSTSPSTSFEDVFDVDERPAPALCSLADLKRHLNKLDTDDDDELRGHLAAATAAVERHLGEVVAKRSFTDRLYARCRERLLLTRHPVLAVTAIVSAEDDTVWDVDDFLVEPTGLVSRLQGPVLWGLVDVTYTAGVRAVAPDRRLAAQIIAAHLWETQQRSHLSGGPTYDEQILTPSGLGFAIPNRAVELLGPRGPMVV
jgi:uncharacterized phiE125 gp8 family phage protein